MRRIRVSILCASAIALAPLLAGAMPGPTRVCQTAANPAPPFQSLEWAGPAPVRPTFVQYGPPSSAATPEIISRAGEILGAIDNPDRRSQLAEQWLQFSKDVIAKDQDFRDNWLALQKQQLAQGQEAAQLRLEVAQLQVQLEELRAQNLRLEQENLQARQQLGPGASNPPAPRASLPTPTPQ
jgi:hypothetical protein